MSRLMCIIIPKFSRAKVLRLEVDPRKTRKFCASKFRRYTVLQYLDIFFIKNGATCIDRDGGIITVPIMKVCNGCNNNVCIIMT